MIANSTTDNHPSESRTEVDTTELYYHQAVLVAPIRRGRHQLAERLFKAGRIPGFIHVSIGQAAGVVSALHPTDHIT